MTQPIKPAVRDWWADLATSGSIADPDVSQPGFVASGWPLSTQPPARQYWNWVLNYCMGGIRYLCSRGMSDWDPAETYLTNAVVLGPNGILYQAVQTTTGNNPATTTGFWGPLNGYSTLGQAQSFVTQAELTADLVPYDTIAARNAALSAYATLAYIEENYFTESETNAAAGAYANNALTQAESYTNQVATNYYQLGQQYAVEQADDAIAAAQTYTNTVASQTLANANTTASDYASSAQAAAITAADANTASKLTAYAPLSDFTNNGTANPGYCKLPNGVYLMWGTTASVGSGVTQNFPGQFSSILSLTITPVGNVQGTYSAEVTGVSTFVIFCQQISAFSWFAVGI